MERARKFLKLRLSMPVSVFAVCHVMIVPVRVSDRMSVRRSVVRVREGVLMNMRVVLYQRIEHNERRACRHHDQRDDISPSDRLAQENESKERSDERGNRVIGACFCRAEDALRSHVEENAEPVRYKAEKQCRRNILKLRHYFTFDQCDHKRAEPRENAVQNNDLIGAFGRNVPRAIVLKAPANGGEQHEKRTERETETVRSLKRKDDT